MRSLLWDVRIFLVKRMNLNYEKENFKIAH